MPQESKKDRRDLARELAREMREQEKKRRRRNRILVQVGVVLGAVAVAAIIALVVTSSIKPPAAGPLNMASDGILLKGDGTGEIVAVPTSATPADGKPTPTDQTKYPSTVNIVLYVDYLCPICGAFEATNAEQIGTWVSQGMATVEYHPISILDSRSLGTKYSTRSAAAAACVANYEPDAFFQVSTALFANQPEENTEGLTGEELSSIIAQAGVTDVKVTSCIKDGTFEDWVTQATDRTNTGPIPNSKLDRIGGTPTVIVNGQQYPGAIDDAAAFASFVGGIAATITPAPAETGTPTP